MGPKLVPMMEGLVLELTALARWWSRWWVAASGLALCLLASPASALDESEVPESLAPWIPWVRAELGDAICVRSEDTRLCHFPGRLELNLAEEGGRFEMLVVSDQRGLVPIPGQSGSWPQDLRVNGKKAPVLSVTGLPHLELPPGRHAVEGRFLWKSLPKTLRVGDEAAFVELFVEGQRAAGFKREGGTLWLTGLGRSAEPEREDERVSLEVVRQVRDGIPLLVETRLLLDVSGKNREVTLPPPLLPGTSVTEVRSDLALALETDGRLRVQLAPGQHAIHLIARQVERSSELALPELDEPWPAQEVWSFLPQPELRSVELSGLAGVDAARTRLPEDWRQQGAYLARPGQSLRIETTRRGQAQVGQNELRIRREWWLDESAQGFTVRDHLEGELHQGFRLDFTGGRLGTVTVGSEEQLITEYQGKRGVELRDEAVSLTAVSRVSRSGTLPAVGWSQDAESLSATLHLPPGWNVLSVSGVDEASHTWVARWDLFDLFHLLLVTIALWRLSGAPAAAAAALALLLCRGESGAPEFVWLPLLALAALLSRLKPGRLRSSLRFAFHGLSLVTLVLLLGFAVDQVRLALFPHLTTHLPSADDFSLVLEKAEFSGAQPPEALPPPDAMEEAEGVQAIDEESDLASSLGKKRARLEQYQKGGFALRADQAERKVSLQKQMAPDAVVQTGPGIPEGAAETVHFSWSGPVHRDHEMSVVLLSPALGKLLTALRLLALGALALLVWRAARPKSTLGGGQGKKKNDSRPSSAALASLTWGLIKLALFSLVSFGWSSSAQAQEPSAERLGELRERMLEPPLCQDSCISVSRLRLTLSDEFQADIEVHAAARGLVKLPGPSDALTVTELEVDGQDQVAARRGPDGMIVVRLEAGVHQVRMRAAWKSDRVTLDLGTPPELVELESGPWSVTGVDEQGKAPGGTITLQRDAAPADGAQKPGQAGIQVAVLPYFHVERTLQFGVDQRVVTRVERISDASSPEVFRLRLLPGERITTSGIEVTEGFAELSFPREADTVLLESTLSPSGPGAREPESAAPWTLTLTAPPLSQSSETWKVECGIVRHCTAEGVVPASRVTEGRALSTYRPWPGETLRLTIATPPPADGASLTIHKATLTVSPGVRVRAGRLMLALQTSRSVVHPIEIPEGAELEKVEVDGVVQAVKPEGRTVRISLSPGRRHVVAEWSTPVGIEAWLTTPEVSAGASGVNFRTVVDLSRSRWLLLAMGPARGPALLFWGYLLLIVVAALLLPRLPFAPLTRVQWLLLGLGLTQVPIFVALLIAGWFFAVGSRTQWPAWGRHRRNLLQLGVVLYTFVFIGSLLGAVYDGLISSPDMEVVGAGSSNGHLVWFVDRSEGALPVASVFSVNVWVWRAFMLLWALWLSRAVLDWLRWGYEQLSVGGFWVPRPRPVVPPGAAPTASSPDPSTGTEGGSSPGEPSADAETRADAESPDAESPDAETRGDAGEEPSRG